MMQRRLVDILFKDGKLEKLCREERVMVRRLGKPCARKLRARLKDLSAAACMLDVKVGRPHPLQGRLAGCMALDLAGGKRLVLEAASEPVPKKEDGGIEWGEVTAVRVVFIGDYHD